MYFNCFRVVKFDEFNINSFYSKSNCKRICYCVSFKAYLFLFSVFNFHSKKWYSFLSIGKIKTLVESVNFISIFIWSYTELMFHWINVLIYVHTFQRNQDSNLIDLEQQMNCFCRYLTCTVYLKTKHLLVMFNILWKEKEKEYNKWVTVCICVHVRCSRQFVF